MRTLQRDVYDALELSAYAFGGIGALRNHEDQAIGGDVPLCVLGHAAFVAGTSGSTTGADEVLPAMDAAFGSRDWHSENDRVWRQHFGPNADPLARMSWETWCELHHVARGAE